MKKLALHVFDLGSLVCTNLVPFVKPGVTLGHSSMSSSWFLWGAPNHLLLHYPPIKKQELRTKENTIEAEDSSIVDDIMEHANIPWVSTSELDLCEKETSVSFQATYITAWLLMLCDNYWKSPIIFPIEMFGGYLVPLFFGPPCIFNALEKQRLDLYHCSL